ncbi:hypothetical protein BZG02_07920 [Labilibaculum filiforme]|uniref:FecR family protein n=1 Tax=Labilibaculum filiforme TaxID=1940526 RepID=A0A2N3I0S5_9BACT|nr:FecR family protein [Labilibaculum filiforme]PKQ63929.1 hypothetical protein BZG02_07920 [Labilibaculum filiforme]
MKNTQEYIRLSQLLAKQLTGELSSIELEQITLLEKEEDKKDILNSVREKGIDFDRLERYQSFNLEEARKKVDWKIRFVEKSKKSSLIKMLRYAAVLALPLALAVYMLYVADTTPSNKLEQVSVEIQPGETKAQLYLSDGRIVDLENQENKLIQETNGAVIEKDLVGLNYQKQHQTNNSLKEVENVVVTPVGGEYQLTLSDGTKVWMNAMSEIRYPVQFSGTTRKVKIVGEVYFEVAKNAGKPFIVDVNDVEIKVLGTQFNVSAYPDDRSIQTTLVEGAIRLKSKELSGILTSVDLSPGIQANYDHFSKHLDTQVVDVDRVTAWKNGKFVFEKESLNDIMRKLERWYDIKVFFQSNELKNKRFSARIDRYGNINDVLEKMQQTTNIRFDIKNNIIQIKKN